MLAYTAEPGMDIGGGCSLAARPGTLFCLLFYDGVLHFQYTGYRRMHY
jgi:hypothetical protein